MLAVRSSIAGRIPRRRAKLEWRREPEHLTVAIVGIIVLLITIWALRILDRERSLETGEIIRMVGAIIVFIVVAAVVLAGLMIGSGETDWPVIVPIVVVAAVAAILPAIGASFFAAGRGGKHSAS